MCLEETFACTSACSRMLVDFDVLNMHPRDYSNRRYRIKKNELTSFSLAPILRAALDGDVDMIKELLMDGVDVNTLSMFSMTPLLYALSRGHVNATTTLLAAGADANLCDSEGTSALMYAIDTVNPVLVKMILDQGVDLKHRNHQRKPALWVAWEIGSIDIAILLMERGAVPNFRWYWERDGPLVRTLKNYKKIRLVYLWRRMRIAFRAFGIGNFLWKLALAHTLTPVGDEYAKLVQEAGALFGFIESS